MVKVEYVIDHAQKVVKFAFQGSSLEDYPTLDLLRTALQNRPDVRIGFLDSKRLIAHFKDLPMDFETSETPKSPDSSNN